MSDPIISDADRAFWPMAWAMPPCPQCQSGNTTAQKWPPYYYRCLACRNIWHEPKDGKFRNRGKDYRV